MDSVKFAKDLKGTADGLSFMILFTFIWTIIAEFALDDWNYRLIGIIFFIAIAVGIVYYLKFNKIIKPYSNESKKEESPEDKKRGNRFIIIFVTEGLAILIARNVLVNINMARLFIPCLALIVGLHFYPLAKLFKRKIHYYVGGWITIISIIGVLLTLYNLMDQNFITAFTGFGCAIGTSIMGIYMIDNGTKKSRLLVK
ncbi:MAG: hypothetical protein P4L45_08495 [Ignavibacteriaceae bacterium]|nr:hypothetical protein [Ignavibacteriaceae bacterium]